MPKSHSQHNYEACEFLLKDGNYLDWVITTAFYSALHLVQEDIFPFRDDEAFEYSSFEQYYSKSRDEGVRISKNQSTIKLVEQRINGAGTLYRNLHDLCKTCRYSNYHVSSKKARIAKSYLDKIRTLVGNQ
ncbi:hypothetical protein [Algibacter sp. 2305UL17-15]|uniref:hypothetical protein n=1 Tax=Algibacter sp. 2305UL17-15 TaxID=3231268 RepID=UPI00345A9630